jgi:hypothetical protein
LECWHKTEPQVYVVGAGLCGKMAFLESSVEVAARCPVLVTASWNFRENLRAAAERAERTMQHGKMTGENMR